MAMVIMTEVIIMFNYIKYVNIRRNSMYSKWLNSKGLSPCSKNVSDLPWPSAKGKLIYVFYLSDPMTLL
jgi:hypothetical protein